MDDGYYPCHVCGRRCRARDAFLCKHGMEGAPAQKPTLIHPTEQLKANLLLLESTVDRLKALLKDLEDSL